MRFLYGLATLGLALLFSGCGLESPAGHDPSAGVAAAARSAAAPDRYIVVFHAAVPAPAAQARELAAQHGAELLHVYEHVLPGFAAQLSAAAVAALERNPLVDHIEADAVVRGDAVGSWGLDRIDQRQLPLDGSYGVSRQAADVHAYILDTGIRLSHQEFGGRADMAFDAIGDGRALENGGDCYGHGTHVAGTVGGVTYGVTANVGLHAVRVLDCNGWGYWSQVIAGLDWVAANRQTPAVANMSLGGSYSSAVNQAVEALIGAGVTVVVSAGNNGADACSQTPASTPAALTIGATTSGDGRASYSNYGTCVDLFAPGSGIVSSTYGSDTSTGSMSGTSMAAPHVTGAAALYLQAAPSATPAQVAAALAAQATTGVLANLGTGSPDLLLFVAQDVAPPPPPPPTAPTGLTATALSETSVDLRWTDTSSGETGFELERRLAGGTWSLVATPPADATASLDAGLQAGTTYDYRVRALGAGGASSWSGTATVTTLTPPPPPPPPPTGALSVAAIAVTVSGGKRFQQGTAAVTVVDDGGLPVAGARVTGTWQVALLQVDGAWALTGADGIAQVSSGKLSPAGSDLVWQFCVTGVEGDLPYDPAANAVTCGTFGGQDPGSAAPVADFDVACTGLECRFTDRSSAAAGLVAWSWDFGDGAVSSAPSPVHTYPGMATYTVVLTVTDATGAVASSQKRLRVKN